MFEIFIINNIIIACSTTEHLQTTAPCLPCTCCWSLYAHQLCTCCSPAMPWYDARPPPRTTTPIECVLIQFRSTLGARLYSCKRHFRGRRLRGMVWCVYQTRYHSSTECCDKYRQAQLSICTTLYISYLTPFYYYFLGLPYLRYRPSLLLQQSHPSFLLPCIIHI